MRWYHPSITGQEAERLLKTRGKPGSFLIRKSGSSGGDYTLSVRRPHDVKHIKIMSSGECYALVGGESYATLAEMVEYYLAHPRLLRERNGDIIELKFPLELDDPTHERWFHGSITTKEAEQALLNEGKDGCFLVHPSQLHPGEYMLSVRVNRTVIHLPIRYSRGHFVIGNDRRDTSLSALIDHCIRNPMVESDGSVVSLKHPLNATRFSLANLAERIAELEKVSDDVYGTVGFSEEFQALQQMDVHRELTRTAGQLPANRPKNRYKNIIPYDKTRVHLSCRDGDTSGDYINANYITDQQGRTAYIATQAPLQHTIEDFWHMVHDQDTRIIINTTTRQEEERQRTVVYWPHGHVKEAVYGDYRVARFEELIFGDYVRRGFIVTKLSSGESIMTWQFHFLEWPDRGVPDHVDGLLNFLDDINEFSLQRPGGPLIVHCSAGIGRTGTFIVIDMLKRLAQAIGHVDIDVQQVLLRLRRERSGLVQTEAQYKLCFMALLTARKNAYRVRREGVTVSVPMAPTSERRGSGGSSADALMAQLCIRPATKPEPEYGNVNVAPAQATEDIYGNLSAAGMFQSQAAVNAGDDNEDIYGNMSAAVIAQTRAPRPQFAACDEPLYGNVPSSAAAEDEEDIYGNVPSGGR